MHSTPMRTGKEAYQMQALEVAGGTGRWAVTVAEERALRNLLLRSFCPAILCRFATYFKDNYPQLHLTIR